MHIRRMAYSGLIIERPRVKHWSPRKTVCEALGRQLLHQPQLLAVEDADVGQAVEHVAEPEGLALEVVLHPPHHLVRGTQLGGDLAGDEDVRAGLRLVRGPADRAQAARPPTPGRPRRGSPASPCRRRGKSRWSSADPRGCGRPPDCMARPSSAAHLLVGRAVAVFAEAVFGVGLEMHPAVFGDQGEAAFEPRGAGKKVMSASRKPEAKKRPSAPGSILRSKPGTASSALTSGAK